MKIVIGSTHLGGFFASQLADAFPEADFVAAYDEASQRRASVDAEVFFGWPSRESFVAARKLR